MVALLFGRPRLQRHCSEEGASVTIVFVHGVPNTAAVWNPVRSLLPDRDTIAVQLPGFGRDAPAGFSGTRYAYRDWLIDQLEAMKLGKRKLRRIANSSSWAPEPCTRWNR